MALISPQPLGGATRALFLQPSEIRLNSAQRASSETATSSGLLLQNLSILNVDLLAGGPGLGALYKTASTTTLSQHAQLAPANVGVLGRRGRRGCIAISSAFRGLGSP